MTTFEQYQFDWKNPKISLLEKIVRKNDKNAWLQGSWGKSDLHYYPFYLWPENEYFYTESKLSKYNLLFNTPSKKILNQTLIKPITKVKHAALKDLLTENVREIKKLIDKIGSQNQFNVSFIRVIFSFTTTVIL